MPYILLIKIGLLVTLISGDNCPYKECVCFQTDIICDYMSLKEVPQKLINNSRPLMDLNLNSNNITSIPAGRLPSNLSGILLDNNPIVTIDETAFDESIITLQRITFSGARFTQIPEAVFRLKALNNLQIAQTNILVWNEDGMKQLGSTLETLSLIAVGLTSWPIWMKSMTNLSQLTVSGCSISVIPDYALDMMAETLTYLDLSNNSLTSLPKSMSEMTALNTLTLNQNKINDVTWLPQSSHLQTLHLNSNKITDAHKLSSVLKSSANTLYNFNIHDNSLTSIPELMFLAQITYLNFSFNHLTDANSGSFPSHLAELHVENNFLSSIPSIMNNLVSLMKLFLNSNNIQFVQGFYIPTCVEILDLSYNLISQLTRSSFPYNSSLNLLILNNNPLSIISSDAFNNLEALTGLNLQGTTMIRLPVAVASLKMLNFFDVSNSTHLVCTCQEQSLRPLVTLLGTYGIIGNCGVTSVYFFYAFLSSGCPKLL